MPDDGLSRAARFAAAAILAGRVKSETGDWAGAEREFSRAARADPHCHEAAALRGAARWRLGKRKAAVEDAHRAVMIDPDALAGFRYLLELAVGSPAGLEAADELVRREPSSGLAWAARIAVLHSAQAPLSQEAAPRYAADLEELARLEPERAWVWAFLGRMKRSLPALDKAVALAPRSGWIRAWRGALLRSLHRPAAEFAPDVERAIRLDPSYRLAFAWRAELRAAGGDLAGALEDLEVCVDHLRHVFFRLFKAGVHWRHGEDERCLQELKTCIIRSPAHAFAYGGLCASLPEAQREFPRGYFPLEVGRLRALAKRRPKLALARAWLGRAALDDGNLAGARAALAKAVALDPGCCLSRAWLGELLAREGKHAQALSELDEALRLEPGLVPAALWHAKVCVALGDPGRARKDLEIARATRARSSDGPKSDLIGFWRKRWLPSLDEVPEPSAPATTRPAAQRAAAFAAVSVDSRIELLGALECLTRGGACPAGGDFAHRRRLLAALDAGHQACRRFAALTPADWDDRRPAAVLLGHSEAPQLRQKQAGRGLPEPFAAALRDFAAGAFILFFRGEAGFYASFLEPLRAALADVYVDAPLSSYLGQSPKVRFQLIASPLGHGFGLEEISLAQDAYLVTGHSCSGGGAEAVPASDPARLCRWAWRVGAAEALAALEAQARERLARAVACRLTFREFGSAAGLSAVKEEEKLFPGLARDVEDLSAYERRRAKGAKLIDFLQGRPA